MLRSPGLRDRILAALVAPVIVLAVLGGLVIRHASQQHTAADETLRLAQASGSFSSLLDGLARERAASVDQLEHRKDAATELKSARSGVDLQLTDLRTRSVGERVGAAHLALGSLRAMVDGGKLTPGAAVTRYDAILDADLALAGELAAARPQSAAASDLRSLALLDQAAEALDQERLTGIEVIRAGRASVDQQQALGAAVAGQEEALTAFLRTSTHVYAPSFRSLLGRTGTALDEARAAFRQAGLTSAPAVSLDDWLTVTSSAGATIDRMRTDGSGVAVLDGTDEAASARRALLLSTVGVVLAALLSLLLGLAVTRRVATPLRRLAEAVTRVHDELPRIVRSVRPDDEPDPDEVAVVVPGRDEVSRLASAFVDVNRLTLDLAREQARQREALAATFVDLARRNQVLLSRQLAIVDQLERVEGDGDVLEDLYLIDHLATRMRRNAESLLVLSGIDSGRRVRQPMSLSDVVRTAIDEIEHHRRVSLALEADPALAPHLALTVTHLLAELLDNATNVSDPPAPVVVRARRTPDGVRVVVSDQGRGMTAEELDEAVLRLEEPAGGGALGSPRVGLLVVGTLARRLDAQVQLRPGPEGHGLSVIVDLPTALFATGALAPSTRRTPPTPEPEAGSEAQSETQPSTRTRVPQLLPVSRAAALTSAPTPAPIAPVVTAPVVTAPVVTAPYSGPTVPALLPPRQRPAGGTVLPTPLSLPGLPAPHDAEAWTPEEWSPEDSPPESPVAEALAEDWTTEDWTAEDWTSEVPAASPAAEDWAAEDWAAEDWTSEVPAAANPAAEEPTPRLLPYDDEPQPAATAYYEEYEAYDGVYEVPPAAPQPAARPYAGSEEDLAFGPEFGYDPDHEPELVDAYTYRPEPDPVRSEFADLYAAPEHRDEEAEPAYVDSYPDHELEPEPWGDEAPAAREPHPEHPEEGEPEPAPELELEAAPQAWTRPTGFPDLLGPSTVEILPQRTSIRTALLRGRRRPAPETSSAESGEEVTAEEQAPVSGRIPTQHAPGRRNNFSELLDPEMEAVDYEGIPAQRGPGADDVLLPEPLLPFRQDEY